MNNLSNNFTSLNSEPSDIALLSTILHSFVRLHSSFYKAIGFVIAALGLMANQTSGFTSLDISNLSKNFIVRDKCKISLSSCWGMEFGTFGFVNITLDGIRGTGVDVNVGTAAYFNTIHYVQLANDYLYIQNDFFACIATDGFLQNLCADILS